MTLDGIGRHAFVIIHGAYGYPEENWFPWLSKELKRLGARVSVPALPTPEGQSLSNWLAAFREQCPALTDQTVLIGHSLGALFILRVLENSDVCTRAAFLVAGMRAVTLGIDKFDSINGSFVDRPLDWARIRSSCKDFRIYHGDNDPYIPLMHARALGKCLHSEVTVLRGAGHVNRDAGYVTFPRLLDDIQATLGSAASG